MNGLQHGVLHNAPSSGRRVGWRCRTNSGWRFEATATPASHANRILLAASLRHRSNAAQYSQAAIVPSLNGFPGLSEECCAYQRSEAGHRTQKASVAGLLVCSCQSPSGRRRLPAKWSDLRLSRKLDGSANPNQCQRRFESVCADPSSLCSFASRPTATLRRPCTGAHAVMAQLPIGRASRPTSRGACPNSALIGRGRNGAPLKAAENVGSIQEANASH